MNFGFSELISAPKADFLFFYCISLFREMFRFTCLAKQRNAEYAKKCFTKRLLVSVVSLFCEMY